MTIVKNKFKEKDVMKFLTESNAIEGVYDADSLKQARRAWDFIISCPRLTLANVLMAHGIMSKNSDLLPEYKGAFRKIPVWIGGREGMEWSKIPKAMDQWIMNANDLVENGKEESQVFLERTIKSQHIKYEGIHPWVDFNGRCGRLVFLWTYVTIGLPIKTIYEKDRQDYYKWFRE